MSVSKALMDMFRLMHISSKRSINVIGSPLQLEWIFHLCIWAALGEILGMWILFGLGNVLVVYLTDSSDISDGC